MQESNQMKATPPPPKLIQPPPPPRIVQTNAGAKDGQNKCPTCGSTDISLHVDKGFLRCNFCRHEFEPEKVTGLETDLSKLEGHVIGSGARNIIADVNEVLTFKCSSCGSEVVIDTTSALQARCHWCRNTLSVNQTIPNGAVPDMVLPFQLKKEEAIDEIQKFVKKRKFFAHPQFKKEFCTENVMGVYLPYMVIDINAHANFAGQGEIHTKTRGKNSFNADLYNVEREFDIVVEGLTVEASADKLNLKESNKTNNIINSIMPFDTENCVKWNANYLKGFTSEKRDTNVFQLSSLVQMQAKDVARYKANDTLTQYDRGVAWSKQDFDIRGKQWKAAYLPVWLYSYLQKDKNRLHYVVVNARTKETMGSIPLNKILLTVVSALITVIGIAAKTIAEPYMTDWQNTHMIKWIFIIISVIYWLFWWEKYRNKNARHNHERETKSTINNLRQSDVYVTERKNLSKHKIQGVNNKSIDAFFFTTDNALLTKYQKEYIDAHGAEIYSGKSVKK